MINKPIQNIVTYSTIEQSFLSNFITETYSIGQIKSIYFYRRRSNDLYFIKTEKSEYILRVYKKSRTSEEVCFEIDLLNHLNMKNSAVMNTTIVKKDGSYFSKINAPEGQRCLALFPWLNNVSHRSLSKSTAFIIGKSLAKIHIDSFDFKPKQPRFELSVHRLIIEPMEGIVAWYENTKFRNNLEFLKKYAEKTAEKIFILNNEFSEANLCHGDVHIGNVMFTRKYEPVWIDFDLCSIGCHMYDIASFYWGLKVKWDGSRIKYLDSDKVLWDSFIKGYQSIKKLSEKKWKNFPYFVIARTIWALGLHANNINTWTIGKCEENSFFESHIKLINNIKLTYKL